MAERRIQTFTPGVDRIKSAAPGTMKPDSAYYISPHLFDR